MLSYPSPRNMQGSYKKQSLALEPVTHSLEGCCSIQMSYGRGIKKNIRKFTRIRLKKQVFSVWFVSALKIFLARN